MIDEVKSVCDTLVCDRCDSECSDTFGVDDGDEVCKSCIDRYYSICDGCEEYFRHTDLNDVANSSFCDGCSSNYHECDGCGCLVGDRDYYCDGYCESCYDENNSDNCLEDVLRNYDSCGSYSNYPDEDSSELFGFELELEFEEDYDAVDVAKKIYDNIPQREIKLCLDGSLNGDSGFEIVSHKFGLNGIKQLLNQLNKCFNGVDNSDLTKNNEVGIHISFNFSNVDCEFIRARSMRNFVYFVNVCRFNWENISRRKCSSDYYFYDEYLCYDNALSSCDKYNAVNTRNKLSDYSGRVEVRTFRSTLSTDTLYNYILVVDALKKMAIDYATNDKRIDIYSPDELWELFCDFIELNGLKAVIERDN